MWRPEITAAVVLVVIGAYLVTGLPFLLIVGGALMLAASVAL